ncbi:MULTISPECIES: hypothetical protein [Variovorax]|jgi:hypothetical protein|uniref:hypothetical protein n=1 Tax=Variovorax TaxID=34072 RepID=UPI00089A99CD|nr:MULTISPECIES: hypothetical protein [Variovorax]MDQ0084345.1 hypothetical protein [Variovorax boronicumulans]SDZ71862.1 hypothetical protein SAMN05518854_12036 [Variovorax sp. YR266]
MRHFHLRRQPHEQQQRVRPSAHAPVRDPAAVDAAPVVDASLDQAAALWTTRRIRSFLVLQPACAPRR